MYVNDKENNKGINTHHLKSQDEKVPLVASFERGVTVETCDGIIDQYCSDVEIARSEALEECGYDVPIKKFERIFSNSNVGYSGNKEIMFFAEVDDSMIVSDGGGNKEEGEFIQVFYLPLAEARDYVMDDSIPKPASLMAAFFWYFWKHDIK